MKKFNHFGELVNNLKEIQDLIGTPSELVNKKVIHSLDSHSVSFIKKSPLVFVSTSNSKGECDVSPRGDYPGFVSVLDDKLLLIPERPGNKRIDSIGNILVNPHVGLQFIIPGLEETLRVNGKAIITKDQLILKQFEFQGKIPVLGIGVEVEECFIHCAKAFKRSNVWKPESWLKKEDRPNAAEILAAHVKSENYSEEKVTELLIESYTKRLY